MSWWSFAFAFSNDVVAMATDAVAEDYEMDSVIDDSDWSASIDEVDHLAVDEDEAIAVLEDVANVDCC